MRSRAGPGRPRCELDGCRDDSRFDHPGLPVEDCEGGQLAADRFNACQDPLSRAGAGSCHRRATAIEPPAPPCFAADAMLPGVAVDNPGCAFVGGDALVWVFARRPG